MGATPLACPLSVFWFGSGLVCFLAYWLVWTSCGPVKLLRIRFWASIFITASVFFSIPETAFKQRFDSKSMSGIVVQSFSVQTEGIQIIHKHIKYSPALIYKYIISYVRGKCILGTERIVQPISARGINYLILKEIWHLWKFFSGARSSLGRLCPLCLLRKTGVMVCVPVRTRSIGSHENFMPTQDTIHIHFPRDSL